MRRSLPLIFTLALALAAPVALADDDRGPGKGHGKGRGDERRDDRRDDHDRGKHVGQRGKTRFEQTDDRYRYRYQDNRCKYDYEYDYRSGRARVEQKGDCRHVALPGRVAHPQPLPRAVPMEVRTVRLDCNRDVIGAVLGGAVGAVLGSRSSAPQDRPIATAGGAVIGAVIGGAIGRAMDRSDHGCAYQALEYAQLRQTVAWDNPGAGVSYTMTPLERYRAGNAECRRFTVRSLRHGQPVEETGRACRQADGSWQPM